VRQGYQRAIATAPAASSLVLCLALAVSPVQAQQLRGGVPSAAPVPASGGLPTSGLGGIGPGGAAATNTSADAVLLGSVPPGSVSRTAPSRASRTTRVATRAVTARPVRPASIPVTGLPPVAPSAPTPAVRTTGTIVAPAVDGLSAYPPRPRRPAPEVDPYAANGLRLGGVTLRPATNDFIGYDTNPDRASGPVKGSLFARGEGELGIQSDWTRHELVGLLRGGYTRYFSNSDASRPDADGRIGLRIDVLRDTRLDLETRLRIDTQRPGSIELNATTIGRPAIYSYGASVGVTRDFNRLQLSLRGSVDRNTYEDGQSSTGGIIVQSDRNQTQYALRLRAAYELTPGIRPFVEGSVDTRQYDDTIDVSGFRRTSSGYGGRVGSTIELTRQFTGEISGGYQQRSFDDTRLRDLRGFVGDAALIWSPTPLTTVTLRGTTELADTSLAGVSGASARRIGIEIAHALRRNITITPFASYGELAYDGSPLREDTTILGTRLDYRLSRTVAIRASFTHERLKSTAVGSDYTANVSQVGLRLQF
jgi:hypothetical protein